MGKSIRHMREKVKADHATYVLRFKASALPLIIPRILVEEKLLEEERARNTHYV